MKRALSLILICCLLFSLFSNIAFSLGNSNEKIEEAQEDISYIFDEETATLTVTGNGKMPDYNWQDDVYPPWYSHKKTAKKVIIRAGITSIGDYAFDEFVAMEEIEIPSSVKSFGEYAFSNSGLKELNIHSGVEEIENTVTVNCANMVSYNVAEDNPNYCSVDGVLFSKDMTVLKIYPIAKIETNATYTIPDSVTQVDECAFYKADNLEQITFGKNIKSIGNECFYNCENLTNVSFNEGLQSIGSNAFQNCQGIERFDLPNSLTKILELAFHNTAFYSNLENWENGMLYIGDYLITGEYCPTDEDGMVTKEIFVSGDITIKEGTKLIAGYAFSWFNWDPNIKSVSFPDSLKYINNYAFAYCANLLEIDLKNQVEQIGEGAFIYCGKLSNAIIPDNVTNIGEYAFYGCQKLSNVHYKGNSQQWKNVSVGLYNDSFRNTVHYNDNMSKPNSTTPATCKTCGYTDGGSIAHPDFINGEYANGYGWADLNNDGKIDYKDLALLNKAVCSSQFGDSSAVCKAADVNGDGIIDMKDIVRMKKILGIIPGGGVGAYTPILDIPNFLQ